MNSVRAIAYYLPQFYPFQENNEWWGEGFTEWTNVGKAKPLFKDHYQPRVPKDLGYYDLRLPEIREAQAKMAKEHGIEGFCYWHYWFGNGKRVLDRVFKEVLESGKPDFPFCLGWANETWSGVWHGLDKKILVEQKYPGEKDIISHFEEMLDAFKDKRYLRIDGKPLFLVYKPNQVPDFELMKSIWNDLAIKNGLVGIYFIAHTNYHEEYPKLIEAGYDAVNIVRLGEVARKGQSLFSKVFRKLSAGKGGKVYLYKNAIRYFSGVEDLYDNCFPTIIPNWDHSPRSGSKGYILHKSTPELFRIHVREIIKILKAKNKDKRIVFIKSWNEWGEGNYMEPDTVYGKQYLEVFKEELYK